MSEMANSGFIMQFKPINVFIFLSINNINVQWLDMCKSIYRFMQGTDLQCIISTVFTVLQVEVCEREWEGVTRRSTSPPV